MALTHLGLSFTNRPSLELGKAPKGKMPWLEDDGQVIADSELILNHLEEKTGGGLYAHLTPLEVAKGTAFVRLAEDHLYWMIVASRWLDDEWFATVKRDFFGTLPAPIGWLASNLARRSMRQTYRLHGLGKHNHNDQVILLKADLRAIAHQVGNEGYIAGQRLTVYDFGVGSMLAAGMDNQPPTWVSNIANQYPELRTYVELVQSDTGIYCREQP
jgi:glutathione S-transferase